MYCLSALYFFFLMMTHLNNLVIGAFNSYAIQNDIKEFNITCGENKCVYYSADSLSSRDCHCGIYCAQLGTCCLDSFYADVPQPKMKPACRSVNEGKYYFIVDQCLSTDSVWETLCNTEWHGESIVPVTSLFTSTTYKNYYCFRCHETTDDFLYWTVKLESEFAEEKENMPINVIYDNEINKWMVSYDEYTSYFPVQLSVKVPYEIQKLTHVCIRNVISDCPGEWHDQEVRSKCHSYMDLKEVKRNNVTTTYRNIHCALCNYESLNDIYCRAFVFAAGFGGKTPFSFTYLLDINRSDGELVGKIQKCSDGHLWDPYTKKCRKLTCALPGYKLKDGKCVQE